MSVEYFIELLTPKHQTDDIVNDLEKFVTRYNQILDAGYTVSIPDNPMGILHFNAVEVIKETGVKIDKEKVLIHLTTFHSKEALDGLLSSMLEIGLNRLLIISGDGNERLPRLSPHDINEDSKSVTSVELLRYIHKNYKGEFKTGVAFNPYEPLEHELDKMKRKIGAGASFIITQPVIGSHPAVDTVARFGVPIVIGAWMSKKLHLLSQCAGYFVSDEKPYDPVENLREIRRHYPHYGVYLVLLGFNSQFSLLPEILK
jgi:methylenetetrahydrofolate reductase (NADPH)